MKHLNNRGVAELFATGSNLEAEGSNLFINGDTVYSYGYHFPIARHTGKYYGSREIILYNSRGYSITTSKHQSYVRGALSGHDYFIIETPGADWHDAEEYLSKRITELEGKYKRARVNKEWRLRELNETREQLAVFKNSWKGNNAKSEGRNPEDSRLKSVAMVAQLGDILTTNQKESNDWKARMLKAGLQNSGLEMPEDWDELSEDEKQRRLDAAIAELRS